MAHVFKITELAKQAITTPGITDGAGFAASGSVFEWTAEAQSSPRNSWRFGVHLRTARDDYPGSDQPVEQVLGPNYTPFTLVGVWDDRYMGAGRAVATQRAFEQLVQRGNLCRFELDGLSISGLITDAEFEYFRSWRIGYSFTVSPHYRVIGGDVRRQPLLVEASIKTPRDYADKIASIVADVLSAQAFAPTSIARGGFVASFGDVVGRIVDQSAALTASTVSRVFTAGDDSNSSTSILRVVQACTGLRALAFELQRKAQLAVNYGATGALPYEDALGQLAFEVWTKSLSSSAQRLALECFTAARDLRRFAQLGTLALYAPYAGESLYGISSRFYNTPHEWRRIADRNRLTQLLLTGSERLVIPSLG
jgi:hypothetical protein